ncbi:DUF1838 family protein [Novosphingobium sp.]|uniref:DUF1838 family protein n=1 Tax=Novosphingobium sp. TaxID=1874826 RepID=UPI00286DDC03|nr:DUF1838 family protein [Novosphingobium sp.]
MRYGLDRRSAMMMAPMGMMGLSLMAGAAQAATSPDSSAIPQDPVARARMRARIIGSTAGERVFMFYRLNIYGYDGGQLVPFFTMNHLSVNQWQQIAPDRFVTKTYECGVYCKFDTDEVLEEWENPFTKEKRKVWQFLGGPFDVTIGPDGIVTKNAELSPKPLRMEAVGSSVIVPTAASMARPSPIDPQKYPKLYAGPTSYWESQATYAAPRSQAFDESVTCADAFCHFQNMGSWHPWLGMGQRPGGTYGNSHGAKLRSLDGIPLAARKGLEKHTPEIFDTASWTKQRMDILEYLAVAQP